MSTFEINFPEDFPVLETKRLSLQAYSPMDAENFYQLRSDEEFIQFLGLAAMKKKTVAREYIHDIINAFKVEKGLSWKIALKGTAELIGYIGFWQIENRHFRAEIGFGIHQDYRKQGLMSEAMEAVLDYGFSTLGIHSVKANVDPSNENSIQLLLKHDFQKEAHFRENYFFDGKFIDSAFYCLIKSDWEEGS